MGSEAPKDHSRRSKRSVQLVTGLGSSVAPFLVASMVVAAPTIGEDLNAEVALLAWLTAAFFLAAASLLIPVGRLADVRGSKKVFTVGMVLYVVSGAVCAIAPDIVVLILGRGLTGVGAAMVFGTSIALLSLVFPEGERGKAIGLNVTFMLAGFTLGLLAGGFLTFYISWRLLFVIAVGLAAINVVLIRWKVKGECELAREKDYDLVGMILFSTSLLLLFYGLSEITQALGQYCLLAGLAVAAGLFGWERRFPRPIISKEVSRNGIFLTAIGTNIILQAGSFAIPFLLSLYSQFSLGLDPREASFILLVPQILMTGMSPVSGRLISKVQDRTVARLGALINAGGLIILLMLTNGTSVYVLIVSLALLGIGTGLFMPALVNWAMGSVVRREYGVASAVTETARLLGMTLSNVVLILVLSFAGSSNTGQGGSTDLLPAVQLCSLAFLIITLSALIPSLMGREKRPARGP